MSQQNSGEVHDGLMRHPVLGEERDDVDDRFCCLASKQDQVSRDDALQDSARSLAHKILEFCPGSPQRSRALRRLEEAVMWANAAITRNE